MQYKKIIVTLHDKRVTKKQSKQNKYVISKRNTRIV